MNISERAIGFSLTPPNSSDLEFVPNNAAVIDVFLGTVGHGGFDFPRKVVGYESSTENTNGNDLSAESSPPFGSLAESKSIKRMPGVRRLKKELEDFPPFLSTLDRSGRPRFTLIKLRSNGRLMIALARSDRPVIVRSYGRDGGLILEMVNWKQQCNGDSGDNEEIVEEREDRDC
ncbi:hypothetical protein JCGZ_21994 [Jatropha curcas]|uniref:Uncharacterized protein n=1 Tax=Jatropha curcas TaxID=180498 RepID=A0A067JFF8_JATCU|nr:uncharacterized protein LOC110011057 [Jatropha curcas]KDP21523.1 hypothetical protein JCGZ_21994 [Jatropha curcas]